MSIASEIQRIQGNIADAYTSCANKGATMPVTQNSANLSATIDSIITGGNLEPKGVDFYDYDGTLLYSYTVAEAQGLTELPTPPTHTGLTSKGWNWTLADIKALNGEVMVGAIYTTSDGSGRIFIEISSLSNNIMYLYFQNPSDDYNCTISWGDGTTTTAYPGRYG